MIMKNGDGKLKQGNMNNVQLSNRQNSITHHFAKRLLEKNMGQAANIIN